MIDLNFCKTKINAMQTGDNLCFKKIGNDQFKGFKVEITSSSITDTDLESETSGYTVYFYGSNYSCHTLKVDGEIASTSEQVIQKQVVNSIQIIPASGYFIYSIDLYFSDEGEIGKSGDYILYKPEVGDGNYNINTIVNNFKQLYPDYDFKCITVECVIMGYK